MATAGQMTHEDARAVIEAASKAELNLPSYSGSVTDQVYLKSWVSAAAASLYGVAASVFDTPTLFSTSLLRDFVHRAVYHNDSTVAHQDLVNAGSAPQMQYDVAAALRYPAYGICGLLGWQLFTVFEAFGFDARRLAANDGSLPRAASQTDLYSGGHVITEVYLDDLGKFALQDATYNAIYTNDSGVPLSFDEVRHEKYILNKEITFEYTTSYVNYQTWGYQPLASFGQNVLDWIESLMTNDWFNVPYSWTSEVFGGWNLMTQFYTAAPAADRLYATRADAVAAVTAQVGVAASWQAAHAAIVTGHDVSGFRLYSLDTGLVTSEWLTVGITGGTFVSVNIGTGVALNGTYDQLMAEAAGSGEDRNPSTDLRFLYAPAGFISPSGTIGYDWTAKAFQTSYDQIIGTPYADRLLSGIAPDALVGGKGDDIYIVDVATALVNEGSSGGYDRVYTSVNYALSPTTQVEYLSASSRTATTDIVLTANRFTEVMAGNAGDNIFYGAQTAQKMFGYGGDDIYYVNSRLDTVNETSGNGTDTIFTTATYVLQLSTAVENLAVTSSASTGRVNLTGNDLANTLTGNAGSNQFVGRGGADTLIGLGGDDTYVVDTETDVVVEAAASGYDVVYAGVSYQLATGAAAEVLRVYSSVSSATEIQLYGNGLQVQIIGHAGRNIINTFGGIGVTVIGQAGDDDYYLNSETDRPLDYAGQGYDRVFVSAHFTLAAGLEIEELATNAADLARNISLTGNSFAQIITGDIGANVLDGKGGLDTLVGGAGADAFVFSSTLGAANVVTISDFAAGTDGVRLDNAVFAGLSAGVLATEAFTHGTDATTGEHRIVYDTSTGALYFDSDGDGGVAKIKFATLSTGLALYSGDFLVI